MITIIVLVLITAPFLWWYSVLRKYKSLDGIPGPKSLPILGSALDVGDTPQESLKSLLKYRSEYGRVYKLFIGNELRVVVTNPEFMEEILRSTVHITKSNAYDLLKPWLGEGLLVSTGNKWKSRRKMITPTFHFKILDQFLEVFSSCGNVLVEKLAFQVGKGSFDVYPYINLYSLDVICETSMGVKVFAQQGQNVEYVEAVQDFLEIVTKRSFSAWKKIDFLFSMTGMYTDYKKSLKILHNFTNNVINRRREEKQRNSGPALSDDGIKRRVALLDMLLESEDHNELSNADLREEIDTFMFEGHDTTTSGIAFTMLCLAENPDVQEMVYDEIMSVVGDEKDLTMQHIQETKYLELVLKEVQRIYPSVPAFERLIEKDCTLGEYNIPKGTFISMLTYCMHHDERYFPDPEKFDPNRFLPENQQQRHTYAYVPFSAGPRNCIGQKFAMLEMKATIIQVVKKFRILSVPNYKPDLGVTAVLKAYNGVCVQLEQRDGS